MKQGCEINPYQNWLNNGDKAYTQLHCIDGGPEPKKWSALRSAMWLIFPSFTYKIPTKMHFEN